MKSCNQKYLFLSILFILCSFLVACGEDKKVTIEKDTEIEKITETVKNSSEDTKVLGEQELAILKSEIRESYAKKIGIDSSLLAEPYLYDLNNDGVEELIVSSADGEINQIASFYLSAFDLNGDEVDSLNDETEYTLSIHNIKNETYGNCIAIIYYGMNGYTADIVTLQKGKLQSIGTVGTSGVDEIISDINADGYEEFAGMEYDYGVGSERVPRAAGFAEKVWFSWDVNKKKYLPEFEVKTADEKVVELDEQLAKRILNAARQTQLSWSDSISWDEAVAKLSPFFSNNFINEYIENGHTVYDEVTDGYSPKFNFTEDPEGVVPDLGKEPIVPLLSDDGNTVTIAKKVIENYEGMEYVITVEILYVKTVKGWKIDLISYL